MPKSPEQPQPLTPENVKELQRKEFLAVISGKASECFGALKEMITRGPKSSDGPRGYLPELSGMWDDTFGEYLIRTGDPFAANYAQAPDWHVDLSTGETTGDIKGYLEYMDKEFELWIDVLEDQTRSENLLRDAHLTGDVRADALQLLRSMGMEQGAERILSGDNPQVVLQSYADIAESILAESEHHLGARNVAYTMIEIKQAIQKILT